MAKSEAETEVTHVDLVLAITVKETYHNRQIRFSVLSHGEPSFLDLQEVGGVDGRGMALNLLFSWISTYFLI